MHSKIRETNAKTHLITKQVIYRPSLSCDSEARCSPQGCRYNRTFSRDSGGQGQDSCAQACSNCIKHQRYVAVILICDYR